MSALPEADRFLLDAVRRGEEAAWTQLVQRYQGRLLAFTRGRTTDAGRAEDLVQDTFVDFLRGLPRYREEASLETFLFTILRRRLIDHYRERQEPVVSQGAAEQAGGDPLAAVPGAEPTGSWYARRDELDAVHRDALAAALASCVGRCQAERRFDELKIVELIFYSARRNRDVARILDITENRVALTKRRWLERLHEDVHARLGRVGESELDDWQPPDAMLSTLWATQRLSCPKRSTIGGYLLGTLDGPWQDYVAFHLQTQRCRFCRANLEDLQEQTAGPSPEKLRDRVLQSTVGFLAPRR